MDESNGDMQSRNSSRRLPDSIQSILGLKRNLTPTWAESVCQIIKDLSSAGQSRGSERVYTKSRKMDLPDEIAEADCIERKIQALSAHLNQLNLQRKQALNDLLDLKGNIRVFCRIRPFLPDEKNTCSGPVIASDSNNIFLRLAENKRKHYSFDKVFHPQSTQEEVFSEIEPVIKSALDGYNVCIFAHGQTGTGKTFTMEGRPDYPGVVPRAINALFEQVLFTNHEFIFSFSMLEIYMGHLQDLLVPQTRKLTVRRILPCLSIQTDPNGNIEIENLVSIKVNNYEHVKKLYRLGTRQRSTASTMSNATSSRSHCLIRISMSCFDAPERRRETNKIWMIDLGGSERLLKTQAKGRRLEEGKAINLSLSALGDVISALQRKNSHIPYRNSKLTQVLRDSLGEDSKTLMLVHVSSKEEDLCETVCTLGFATRVRSIHLGHEESTEDRAVKEAMMVELLQKVNNHESECQNIRRDIQQLTKMFRHSDGSEALSEKHSKASITEEELSTMHTDERNFRDKTNSSKKLPRFMRPTICSQRKTGLQHQNQESARKKPIGHSKRRKSSSVYAESMTHQAKSNSQSEYGTECCMSGTGSLDWKYVADCSTEYSQDVSECEIKTVVFPEQQKSLSSPMASICSESNGESENYQTGTLDGKKYLQIDNWIDLQMGELTHTNLDPASPPNHQLLTNDSSYKYNHQNKRVVAFLIPEEKQICCELNHGVMNKEVYSLNLDVKHDHVYSCDDLYCTVIGDQSGEGKIDDESALEVVMDETPTGLLSNMVISNDDKDMHCDYNIVEKFKLEPESQKVPILTLKEFKFSTIQYVKVDQEEGIETPAYDENTFNINSKTEHFCGFQACYEDFKKPNLSSIRSRKALFLNNDILVYDQKSATLDVPIVPITQPRKQKQNPGICHLLGQTIQTLSASVLLGLGLKSLGLGGDFFHGLTF